MDPRRENDTLQLQLWDPRAKTYVVAQSEVITAPGWRRVDPAKNRPLTVPPLRRKPLAGSRGRDALAVQADYLKWAQAKGLKLIHVYPCTRNYEMVQKGYRKPTPGPAIYTCGHMITVDPAEQFAVIETSDDTAWLEDAA